MWNKRSVSMGVFMLLIAATDVVGYSSSMLSTCHCDEDPGGWTLESIMQIQLVSDFLIALAYFSIPFELIYFISCTKAFPFWWVVVQFGTFIVLCGLTHFVAIWTYVPHSFTIMLIQTVLKVLTALVSCATAISLFHIIPELLNVKVREFFLRSKAEELNRKVNLIKREEETGRHVRNLTQEIRSSIDRHTILEVTLEELGATLDLENCSIWMPNADGNALELTHELKRCLIQDPMLISINDPIVETVKNSKEAVVIPPSCALGVSSSMVEVGSMAAIRLPLLRCSNFKGGTPERLDTSYAIMVLMLPNRPERQWSTHELEIVQVVADQVAVALSHAAVLEESYRIQNQLIDQNKVLQQARKDVEIAIRARNEFLVVMNHELRTPLHAITALTSLLQQSNLSCDQQSIMGTLCKSSSLLSSIINDLLDYSRLEERGNFVLDLHRFDLIEALSEVANIAKPIAKSKKLRFAFEVSEDVPHSVIGDENRLLQVILSLVENTLKFRNGGLLSVMVKVEDEKESRHGPRNTTWQPSFCEGSCYVRVEIRETGLFVGESNILELFQKLGQVDKTTPWSYSATGLSLALCKRFVQLMDGHLWIESYGRGLGSVVTFLVRLQLPSSHVDLQIDEEPLLCEDLEGLKVLVTDDNIVSRTVTCCLLEKLGCQTIAVQSGHECLAILSRPGSSFKLVLLDLYMPDMDGYEVVIRIQQKFHPDNRPLIVALTANNDKNAQEQCLKIGMDGIILKPVSLAEMSIKLSRILLNGQHLQYKAVR